MAAHHTVLNGADVPAGELDSPSSTVPWLGIRPQTDVLVGRQDDLRHMCAAVKSSRLLVLTGSGGVGKTRLALASAAQLQRMYRDGVAVVELGSLLPERDREREALTAVTEAVKTRMSCSPAWQTTEFRMLLVIDNAEHVLKAVTEVSQRLLHEHPGLDIIVTSRRPLALMSATSWEVAPLPVDSPSGTGHSPAVELFLIRAHTSVPTLDITDRLPAVTTLCTRLDAMPLAIEVAAHRLRSVSLNTLLQEAPLLPILDQISLGSLSRHRPLSSAAKWSYDLLNLSQRTLLHHLAAIQNPFTIEDVTGFDSGADDSPADNIKVLAELVDNSVVQVRRGHEYVYRVPTLIREYVNEYVSDLAARPVAVPV
ncbi:MULTISPECIES: ATPase [unclassified Streptomyces]|uniref:ATP-binding protein n=1 Tax=unclassified Streptomyces TaxID=2593676 RepID=UPI002E0F63DA|nr:ATPase [Streptomyces sp. NBC_01197]WSS47244.1 ATPase [Streptomyces sp. NBC_01180]